MKNNFITKIKRLSFVLLVSIAIFSCETVDLDINDNPNALTQESADPNFILNGIQLTFANQAFSFSQTSSGTIRHLNQFGTYAASSGATTMNGVWANTYSIGANLQLLKAQAEARGDIDNLVGVGMVLEAWSYINLVDYIGTAVYSEALDPDQFPNPNLDSGRSIYEAMYAQLDEAIVKLRSTNSLRPADVFYPQDAAQMSRWIKVANTLKLKILVQTKLTSWPNALSDLNAIIASGNYIKDASDDLVFRYGTNVTNPDTRHPWFRAAYITGAGGRYMSNSFMTLMKDDKGFQDPRLRYYFYRQSLTDPAADLLPCAGNASYQYCYIGDFYWGRDHGDSEGIPNDGSQRTTYGIYPAGGAYDNNTGGTTQTSSNLAGAGIFPIWLSSFSKFMLAEASLPSPQGLGASGNSLSYYTSAIEDSFSLVSDFSGVEIPAADITNYVTYVTNEFNSSSSTEKLDRIMREYYIAMFGNSIEAYNNYRRTGMPTLGVSVEANTDFPRSYRLPLSELNANDNPNVVQKNLTDQVFWDTNPAGFIN